jgi:ABC-type transport system involved in cytochrome bd biosynthesis fused ATPase/permease subunit
MIFKIIGLIFGYLLCGVGTLELVKLHDRHSEWINRWVDDSDELDEVFVVVLFPVLLLMILLWAIGKAIAFFIKVVRTVFITIVYIIVALVKGEK